MSKTNRAVTTLSDLQILDLMTAKARLELLDGRAVGRRYSQARIVRMMGRVVRALNGKA